MVGTIVNAAAIVVGSSIGLLAHSRLPQKIQTIVFQGLGLVTLLLGISMALKTENFLVVVLSVVLGAIVGQWIDIDKLLRTTTERFTKGKGSDRATQGFMTATLLFCVGSMAILGAIQDGLGETPTLLYTKSVMDGFTSIAFAATFGVAVMFSALPLLLYQGALTLCAAWMMSVMSDSMVAEMTAVGGVMLVGLGLTILEIKEIKVTNMLPSLIFAIIFAYIF